MADYLFKCCEHCGDGFDEMFGHDDTCANGCNDEEMEDD